MGKNHHFKIKNMTTTIYLDTNSKKFFTFEKIRLFDLYQILDFMLPKGKDSFSLVNLPSIEDYHYKEVDIDITNPNWSTEFNERLWYDLSNRDYVQGNYKITFTI